MKILKLTSFFLFLTIVSCYSDKGNYNYSESKKITFENIKESYNIIGGAEKVVIEPKIISSVEGVISKDDSNYGYEYLIDLRDRDRDQPWSVIAEGSQSLDSIVHIPTGAYKLWIKVIDKRSGIAYSTFSKLVVSSSTYEGWLVFGTEGTERRSRLDMVSYISADRLIPTYDLMPSRGLPGGTTGAYGIGFWPNYYNETMDRMYLMTDQGAYLLEKNEFGTSEKSMINYVDFVSSKFNPVPVIYRSQDASMIVTIDGDAYSQYSDAVGAKFAYPINTTKRGANPEFKVAPFLGFNALRPGPESSLFVFYDITNKRFMGWNNEVEEGTVLYPLLNPSTGYKFDYNIGMDMLYMEGTSFDQGVAYAVLKDKDGDINIAGIKVNSENVEQHSYYSKINSPKIKQATKFAFHSQFPLMFYVADNEVYCYNLGTGNSKLALSLPNEEITLIKFNLFGNWFGGLGDLNKMDDEFLSTQYKLIVASYNNTDAKNGGKFGLYNVDAVSNSLSKNVEYTGFCKIADIVYRERRAMFN